MSSTFSATRYWETISATTYLFDEHRLLHLGQLRLDVGMKITTVEQAIEMPVEVALIGALLGRLEDLTGRLAGI